MSRGMLGEGFDEMAYWLNRARESGFNAKRMAALCGLSNRQLGRRCLERWGRSTQNWLNEQRIVAARWLLLEQRNIKAVSYSLGFKQVSHFSREFKRYHGITASEFLLRTAWPVQV